MRLGALPAPRQPPLFYRQTAMGELGWNDRLVFADDMATSWVDICEMDTSRVFTPWRLMFQHPIV